MKYQIIKKNKSDIEITYINGGKKDLPTGDEYVVSTAKSYFDKEIVTFGNLKCFNFIDIVTIYGLKNLQKHWICLMSQECVCNSDYLQFVAENIQFAIEDPELPKKAKTDLMQLHKEIVERANYNIAQIMCDINVSLATTKDIYSDNK